MMTAPHPRPGTSLEEAADRLGSMEQRAWPEEAPDTEATSRHGMLLVLHNGVAGAFLELSSSLSFFQ